MSNRYLIGTGARNWSSTAIWSTDSNGIGGASVPTLSDNVIFDQYSGTGAITLDVLASCSGFNCADITSAISIVAPVYSFNVYGDFTAHATLITFNLTGTSYFRTKGSGLYTSNGFTFTGINRWFVDAGTVTQGDTITINISYSPNLTGGNWDTNDKTFNGNNFNTYGTSGNLRLRSSTFTASDLAFPNGALTVTCDTSTVKLSSANQFRGTYYNLNIQSSSYISRYASLRGDLIVLNDLNLAGAAGYRFTIRTDISGTQRTITANTITGISNVDFVDIVGAGTANWNLSASNTIGDCGNNAGITFPVPMDCYLKHTSGSFNYNDITKWKTTDGGLIQARVPLAQDRIFGTVNSLQGSSTLVIDKTISVASIDFSGINQLLTITLSSVVNYFYGDFIINQNVSLSTNPIYLHSNGNFVINTNGKTIYNLSVIRGIYTLLGDLICNLLDLGNCIFYANNFNITGRQLGSIGGYCTVYMGNGIWETTGVGGAISAGFNTANGVVVYCQESTIKLNSSSSGICVFNGVGKIYNNLWITGDLTSNNDIRGSNTFNQLKIEPGCKVRFTAGTTTTIGKLTAIGTQDNPITIGSVTAATHNLVKTGVDIVETDYCNISYSNATPTDKWYVGDRSTNEGNNSGWTFTSAFSPIVIWLFGIFRNK